MLGRRGDLTKGSENGIISREIRTHKDRRLSEDEEAHDLIVFARDNNQRQARRRIPRKNIRRIAKSTRRRAADRLAHFSSVVDVLRFVFVLFLWVSD